MTLLQPRDVRDVVEAVSAAFSSSRTLEIIGSGSRRSLGRPMAADAVLDLSAIAGITLYEPEELVLTARAGTPLREINATVARAGQQLAFEPPDFGALWNLPPDRGSLAGVDRVGRRPAMHAIISWASRQSTVLASATPPVGAWSKM
jgi:glycolate oxidase FAD binding subunit